MELKIELKCPFIPQVYNILRKEVPLMDPSAEEKTSSEHNDDDVIIEKTNTVPSKGWTALPLCQYKLTSIRFDLKTINAISKANSINEFLDIGNRAKLLKTKKNMVRKNAKTLKKVNRRRIKNGLGVLIKPGWEISSFQTNGISISLIMTKSITKVLEKESIDPFELAKSIMNGPNNARLISDDTGRVNLNYTSELKSDKTYEHKRLTKKDYFKKSSVDYYTELKVNEKKSNNGNREENKFIWWF